MDPKNTAFDYVITIVTMNARGNECPLYKTPHATPGRRAHLLRHLNRTGPQKQLGKLAAAANGCKGEVSSTGQGHVSDVSTVAAPSNS